jgi:hypothetical protein
MNKFYCNLVTVTWTPDQCGDVTREKASWLLYKQVKDWHCSQLPTPSYSSPLILRKRVIHTLCRPTYRTRALSKYVWISHRHMNISAKIKEELPGRTALILLTRHGPHRKWCASNSYILRIYSLRSKKGKSYPCNKPWRPIGLWDVEASTFSRQSAHRWRGEGVSLTRRPPFVPQNIPGTHFC